MRRSHPAAAVACVLLDIVIAALFAASIVILLTGGGTIQLAGLRIRSTSLTNPTAALMLAVAARYALRRHLPFAGRFPLERAGEHSLRFWNGVTARVSAWDGGRVAAALVVLTCLALFGKLAGAWTSPGFFSGDDVEVHEMTLSSLRGEAWPIWKLRTAFFPMGFIYPAQWLAYSAGWTDPRVLVFAGRTVVAILSSATIALTWVAGRLVMPGAPAFALAAAAFVTVNQLQMSFGSSELPRPVATVFVLAAFVLLHSRTRFRTASAGVCLGLAAAFRFSEAVFVFPAAAALALRRERLQALGLCGVVVATAALAIGISDVLYWGEAFSSIRHAIEYTLVQKASSRGYEPTFAYVALLPYWTNWTVVALAVVGSRSNLTVALWLWIPVLVLSLLPHKETRYLIPATPYLALAAAIGLERCLTFARDRRSGARADAVAALLLPFIVIGIIQDAGGWRLPRSNDEVRLAMWLREQGPGGVAIRHVWRAGGRVYLHGNAPVVDIDDERLATREGRREIFKDVRWIVADAVTARALSDDELTDLGFRPQAHPFNGRDRLFVRFR